MTNDVPAATAGDLSPFSATVSPRDSDSAADRVAARENHGGSFALLLAILGPVIAFLAGTALVTLYSGIEPSFFTRDPASTLGGHPLTGLQSHLGVLGWWTGASICVFGYALLQRRAIDPVVPTFLLCFALFTFVLAFDDLFRVHEDLARRYLGVRQRHVFLAYGAVCFWVLVYFRALIARSEYVLLALALGFFGASLVIDVFEKSWTSRWCIYFEDGFKLLGIVSWSTYLVRTGFHAIAGSFPGPTASDLAATGAPPAALAPRRER